jgi:hypothetical protein
MCPFRCVVRHIVQSSATKPNLSRIFTSVLASCAPRTRRSRTPPGSVAARKCGIWTVDKLRDLTGPPRFRRIPVHRSFYTGARLTRVATANAIGRQLARKELRGVRLEGRYTTSRNIDAFLSLARARRCRPVVFSASQRPRLKLLTELIGQPPYFSDSRYLSDSCHIR